MSLEKNANTDYIRLTGGLRLNMVNKPYTIIYINKLILYFEVKEEYEKCGALVKVKEQILNHNNNYCL